MARCNELQTGSHQQPELQPVTGRPTRKQPGWWKQSALPDQPRTAFRSVPNVCKLGETLSYGFHRRSVCCMKGLQRGDSCGGRRGGSWGGGWEVSHTARHTAAERGWNTRRQQHYSKDQLLVFTGDFLVVDLQNFGIRKFSNIILVM